MNDEFILQDIDSARRRAPNGPDEQRQYYRLIHEGYLRRLPVGRTPGDTGDTLICELTDRGRQRLHGRR